ncbi:MAG: TonB-dependent receptor [Acidobacteria bacterium]|nr:TonB-dependent receptor [Acidobacteriota bacterium]
MITKGLRQVSTLSLLLVLTSAPALSQSYTASIRGVVTDPTQSAVPNAQVVATETRRNILQRATTDAAGRYVLTNLPPGEYTLTAEASGFKKYTRESFPVQVNQDVTIDVALQVGEVTESVSVSAEAPLLESSTSSVGKVVENREIVNLPLNTRNPYQLVFLTPGVSGSVGINYDDMRYSVNGARVRMLDTLVDGVAASHPTVNGAGGISVFPSVESIAEFKVMGANPPAEFGRSQGSILNVVYRSGANQLHFSLIEFLRNSEFDANSFFSNRNNVPLTSFRRNQFGADVSGPIRRDKTFFLFDYAGLRERSASASTFTVPTALERAGDFSATRAANGQVINIFSPFTTRSSGSGFVRDPFEGNRIPASLIDPVAQNVMKYYPQPNTTGNPVTNQQNYYKTGARALNIDQFDIRVDHNFSERRRAFGRYSNRTNQDAPPAFFPDQLAIAEGRVITENHMHNAVADYTENFTPTTVFNVRLGFARSLFVYNNQGLGFPPSQLGLPGSIDLAADRLMFPAIRPSGYQGLGGNDHRRSGFNTGTLLASLGQIKSAHTIKYGFEGRLIRVNVWEARDSASFSFSQSFTQGPNPNQASSTAGNSIASLLLGAGSSGNLYQAWKNVAAQSFYYAGYLQDDWRLGRKLTLNLGLRYEYDQPRTERYNRFNWFDPFVPSPLASKFPGLAGGLQFVGVDNHARSQYTPDRNNWSPRLGLAYQATPKTVIRMGYGHLFGLSPQEAIGTVGPYGFRVENTWQTSADGGLTPLNLLRNPYPSGFRPPPGAADGLATGVGGPIQAPLQATFTPWSMQWNFTIQRELPSRLLLEVAYVGTRGLQLSRGGEGGFTLNQLPLSQLSLGNRLLDTVDNPFYVPNGPGFFANRTVARNQLLRPYPQFTDVIPLFSSGSSSTYHGLQTTIKKRLSMGLQFEGSYTWSKSIDNGEGGFQDSNRIRLGRAVTDLDVPHRFILNYVYELPFGRGKRFGNAMPRLMDTLFGGWMLDGITNYQSGGAFGVSANNVCRCFNQASYANSKGYSAKLEGRAEDRLGRWFDTSAFSQPDQFTIGSMGPRSADLRNDKIANWDIGISKDFHPLERLRVQFRSDFLNAFNHPRFSGPNTSVTSSSFGTVTGQSNAPRQIQFGLKLLW